MRGFASVVTAGIALCLPALALAAPSAARHHDGFYARFTLGFGGYRDAVRSDESELYGGRVSGVVSGFATATSVAVGGTPVDGLVVGGGAFNTTVLASGYRSTDGRPLPSELDPQLGSFDVIGPFADWYFDASSGLHLELAGGLATMTGLDISGARYEDRSPALGGGALVGFGNEWWVGDEWSLGVLGRIEAGLVRGDDASGVSWRHTIVTFPVLLLSITYH